MRVSRDHAWDFLTIASGVLLAGTTLFAYRYSDLNAHHEARTSFSLAEADLRSEAAKAALATHPDDLNALTELAIAQYQKGRHSYVDALNALEKARSLGATDETLFFYAGVMYDALGLPEYAANEFSKYLRHYPNDYEASIRLANADVALGKTDDALVLYKAALRAWPKDPNSWFNYAVVNIKKNDPKEAATAMDQVHALVAQMPAGGFFEQGEIARLQGNDDEAILSYNQELVASPNDLSSLQALESAQRRKSLFKDAALTHKRLVDARALALKSATPSRYGQI